DLDLRQERALVVVEAVGPRRGDGHAEAHRARDDRDLPYGVGARRQHPDERVPGLVVGGPPLVLGCEGQLACGAELDLLERVGKVAHPHAAVRPARGEQRGLVGEVRQVGPDHSDRRRGDRVEVDVRCERQLAGVDEQDPLGPSLSGACTLTLRSKRPGLSSAGSSTSGRFVAARTITPVDASKPSISVRIWFRVCSRSSFEPLNTPLPRERPMASISSMKMMDGAAAFACANRSRTREAPTPTIISTNSDADMEKKGTPASPATAFASSVLPVPGEPLSSTPRGMCAPSFRYFSGSRRKSTTSVSSSFASSMPATSL